ncbi:unnamed protein product [Lymnaea stagnalis]|uniref:WD repeat-containing protein 64 n=1 Tax=Lymnaea stagnalis TaxID=6523 RepID=A0AAV2H6X4_LYMST
MMASRMSDRPYTEKTFKARLYKFERFIKSITQHDGLTTPDESRQWITENVRFDKFCAKIRDLFGPDIQKQDLKSLYRKISTNPGAKVDWSEVFGFNTKVDFGESSVGEEVRVFLLSGRRKVGEAAGDKPRRDTIQRLKYIDALDCYISCSQKGAITVWSNKLRLQTCIDIHEPAWTTCCDYLPGLRRVICTTERSIALWDNRAKGNAQGLFIIKPIEDSPQCVAVLPTLPGEHGDTVLYGDDQGYLNLLTLLPQDLTVKHVTRDRRAETSQSHTLDPNKLTHPIIRRKIHKDSVLKVKYFPSLKCFASCSNSSSTSFVLEKVDRIFYLNQEPRSVAVYKGVSCFDFCVRANIIATGGVDKVIRLWHPHIFSRPSGKLTGHLFTIVDIVANETDQHIISLSTARVFRIWDIHTLACLQVFTDNEDRPGDKRIYSITFDDRNGRLLSGSSVVDSWPLSRTIKEPAPVPLTHDRPIILMLLNKEFNQLVSVCTEPVLKVWEVENGKLVYCIEDPHGSSTEVTALTLDVTNYRLITGAFDGSLKIWDFGSGQMVKAKMTTTSSVNNDRSITSLVCTRNRNDNIIIANTKKKIQIYLDAHDSNRLVLVQELTDLFTLPKDIGYVDKVTTDDLLQASPSFQFEPTALSAVSKSLEDGSTTPKPVLDLSDFSHGISSKKGSFLRTGLLPDIKKNQASSACDHEVTCITLIYSNLVASGCYNGDIIVWDTERMAIQNLLTLPNGIKQELSFGNSRSEHKVNQIVVMKYRIRNHRQSTIQQTADALSASLTKHRSRRSGVVDNVSLEMSQVGSATPQLQQIIPKLKDEQVEHVNDTALQPGMDINSEQDDEMTDVKETMITHDDLDTAGESKGSEYKCLGSSTRKKSSKSFIETRSTLDSYSKSPGLSYEIVLASAHNDGYIRFWNLTGELLCQISTLTPKSGSPLTALCYNEHTRTLVAGDTKGYLTVFDTKRLLQDHKKPDSKRVKQKLCWRAHTATIVSMVTEDGTNKIMSTSSDGSIRQVDIKIFFFWWEKDGTFIGYFGQQKPLGFPTDDDKENFLLPFDITEGPIEAVEKKTPPQKTKIIQKFEFPLIFSPERWVPLGKSGDKDGGLSAMTQDGEKKFFGALIKPKAYNSHLDASITADKESGAVFRALPVYRVVTPETLKRRNIIMRIAEVQRSMASLGPRQLFTKTNKVKHKEAGNLPNLASMMDF